MGMSLKSIFRTNALSSILDMVSESGAPSRGGEWSEKVFSCPYSSGQSVSHSCQHRHAFNAPCLESSIMCRQVQAAAGRRAVIMKSTCKAM